MKKRLMLISSLLFVVTAAFGQSRDDRYHPEDNGLRPQPENHQRSMTIEVGNARIIFLTHEETDPGKDLMLGTADDDTAGPFFVVIGDITTVDGKAAAGKFVCRGIIFTSKAPPQPDGIAQVNVTFDITGRGILFGQSIEFKTGGGNTGAIIGGTGDFERLIGVYTPSGAPSPLGDGKFTFTLKMQRPL